MAVYQCPHCGEQVDTTPDAGGADEQQYIEDCPVCCRANVLTATYDSEEDSYSVFAERE